jgi:class 3 adenylate cyclase/predicted ATPase
MRDVVDLLEEIGLGQYAESFRAHAIDAEAVRELTDHDLKELGLPLGHRKKLLRTIALLDSGPTVGAAARVPASPGGPGRQDAERRHLTVMFCDLVGSTELAARLDPEDLGEVIGAYHDLCAGVIGRFDGHMAKFLGDGLLAYFGYPRAHGDDAERAIRAGLELVDAVRRLAPRPDVALHARVGVSTGEVVVGDLLGPSAGHEVVGETPNRAARLQALAEPDSVVIGPRTRDLVGGLFEYADLSEHRIKGFEEPVHLVRVLGPSAAARFEALRSRTITPLVGREQEIALLMQRWEQAREGEGHVVLLTGEPGIGKSRIVRALGERIAERSHRVFGYQCLPYYRNSALQPVIEELERSAGMARSDDGETRLAKLSAHLAVAGGAGQRITRALADLLAIPHADRGPSLEPSPERRKARTLDALVQRFEAFAARLPILIVIEDAHWIDPTTRELLERITDAVPGMAALLVVTERAYAGEPGISGSRMTALSLSRLSRRECATLVRQIAGKDLPDEIVAQIVDKTDGVPLFVEELTRAVLESGKLRDAGDRYVLEGTLTGVAIPATLHESLMARLDRLTPAKEVAQIASVIGRQFSFELLAAVAPQDQAQLEGALDHLVDTGLILRRGEPPEAVYSFKHALVQEAAYGTLLRARREQLHTRIARALAADFPEVMEGQPELIAHHCSEAGLHEEAVEFWREAGEQALERSTPREAVAHLGQALDALRRCPPSRHRDRAELRLQITLGQASIAARSFAAPETGDAFGRARQLALELGEPAALFPPLFGSWIFHIARAEVEAGLGLANEMLQIAEAQKDATLLLVAYRAMANTYFFIGDLGATRRYAEQAMVRYDPPVHRRLASQYSADPNVLCGFFLAHALLRMGFPDRARLHAEQALAHARALGHLVTLAHALHHACLWHQLAREPLLVRQHADELIVLTSEHGLPFWLATAQIFSGWAQSQSGSSDDGYRRLRQGLAAYRATGGRLYLPYALVLQADLCRALGRFDEALNALEEARGIMQETGVRGFEPHLHRVEASSRLEAPDPDLAAVEACFMRAMEVARAQEARLSELRSAVDLGRLWRDRGRAADAYGLVAPIYGRFTEGFDVPDLRAARRLLDELATGI